MVQGTGCCCIGLLPALLATIGVIFAVAGNVWCETVQFPSQVDNPPEGIATNFTNEDGSFVTLKFGLFYMQDSQLSQIDFAPQGYVAVTDTCVGYSSDVNIDTNWLIARIFGIVAPALGGLLTLLLWATPCVWFMSRTPYLIMTLCYLILLPLCQGLTALILTSDVCTNNPVMQSAFEAAEKAVADAAGDVMGSSAGDAMSADNMTSSSAGDVMAADNATSAAVNAVSTAANATIASDNATISDNVTRFLAEAGSVFDDIYSDKCEMGVGFYACLLAVILFFFTGVVMLILGAPTRPPRPEPTMQTVTYTQKPDAGTGEPAVVEEVQITEEPVKATGPTWTSTGHQQPTEQAQLY